VRHPDGSPWWQATVGDLGRLSLQRTQLDPVVYPLTAPHLAATDDDVTAAEARLGHPLDRQHRALLQTVDGWPDMSLDGDLLSTHELGQGSLWQAANLHLDQLYEEGNVSELPARDELLPVFASQYHHEVMVLWTAGPVTDGGRPVLWIGNELTDHWPNVYEWILGMTVLLQCDVEDLRAELEANFTQP